MTGYDLQRNWFNWTFENPMHNSASLSGLYFWVSHVWNRLGQKQVFTLSTNESMEALGIKRIETFSKLLSQLEQHGFIRFIERSKNQYTANIIELLDNQNSTAKSLEKAMISTESAVLKNSIAPVKAPVKANVKHLYSTRKSTCIAPVTANVLYINNKLLTINNKQQTITNYQKKRVRAVLKFFKSLLFKNKRKKIKEKSSAKKEKEVLIRGIELILSTDSLSLSDFNTRYDKMYNYVKDNSLESIFEDFDFVWDLYDKKVGDKDILTKKFNKLSKTDKLELGLFIPKYRYSQPKKKYRKNFDAFLNNKAWKDELIF